MAFKQFTTAEREAARARELAEQQGAESKASVVVAARIAIIDALKPIAPEMSAQDTQLFDGLMLDRTYFDRDGVAGGSLARLSEQRANGLRVLAEHYLPANVEPMLEQHLAHLYCPADSVVARERTTVDAIAGEMPRHALAERWVYCATCNAKLHSEYIAPGEKAEDRRIPCVDRQKCEEETRGL
ncbi:hypothetical protein VI03_25485 [Burkholderia vietnamiensis]|uniref:hypothetical protein n=1 Tax=Burkholderia vietnamiensis TaxID=60552 RepID=UPI000620FA4E|nr:hypothetical protein [Burkholderia vietnamiensis]KKI36126.1 hypothetical protein VI03_25485 [Burkholderia vietnamiensis]MBR8189099.1 hypothetical protein [Burkholderia vietnamiensis]